MENKKKEETWKNVEDVVGEGYVQVKMNPCYLSQEVCKEKAADILKKKEVKGMSAIEIAQEIYAHACCFYGISTLKKLGIDSKLIEDIYKRADPVDITDNGDTPKRVIIYTLIGNLSPKITVDVP